MAEVKIVVMYPQPKDVAAFEKAYLEEHMPLAAAKLIGASKVVLSKAVSFPPFGTPQYHRIAEIHFRSMEALQACLASPGGQETAAHAVAISTGGAPVVIIAEEETQSFSQQASA